MAAFLLASFYATMVAAGLLVELAFDAVGLLPQQRAAKVVEAAVTWKYTAVAQPGAPGGVGGAGGALPAHRWAGDAEDDGWPTGRAWARPLTTSSTPWPTDGVCCATAFAASPRLPGDPLLTRARNRCELLV
jgi:hypothetical protein